MADWEKVVRGVPHDVECCTLYTALGDRRPCDCSRDARIAKGIEAALARPFTNILYEWNKEIEEQNTEALAAFQEATRV